MAKERAQGPKLREPVDENDPLAILLAEEERLLAREKEEESETKRLVLKGRKETPEGLENEGGEEEKLVRLSAEEKVVGLFTDSSLKDGMGGDGPKKGSYRAQPPDKQYKGRQYERHPEKLK